MEDDDDIRHAPPQSPDLINAALSGDGQVLHIEGVVGRPAVLSSAFLAILAGEDLGDWVMQCLARGSEELAREVRAQRRSDADVARRLAAVDPFQSPSKGVGAARRPV